MKITAQHYATILNAIAPLAHTIPAHRILLSNDSKVHDIEKRLRWDLSYKAGLNTFLCDSVYSYANDDHIDTALKNIVKQLEALPK
jgi:hypothetical protein